MKVAIGIKTAIWNEIILGLQSEGWCVVFKYDQFDAGIDFDLIIMKKGVEVVYLGWDNWLEGELKCSDAVMNEIEQKLNMIFTYGDPTNLKPEIIELAANVSSKK